MQFFNFKEPTLTPDLDISKEQPKNIRKYECDLPKEASRIVSICLERDRPLTDAENKLITKKRMKGKEIWCKFYAVDAVMSRKWAKPKRDLKARLHSAS
jgi:hypothetical protein